MAKSPLLSLRLENLYQKLNQQNLDGFFISSQPNITYLTGFNSRDSYLLINCPIKKDKKVKIFFITDFRYWQEARQNLPADISTIKINGSVFDLIVKLSKYLKIKKLGFEAKNLTYAEYKILKDKLPSQIEFTPIYDLVESLREIKSEDEIQKIKMATEINIQAFQYVKKVIRAGLKEKQIAGLIENFIKSKGAKPAFETIVAAGPNSSFPHHISSDYKLKKNELILIDMGVDFEGYKSDLTRIFILGKIPFIIKKIHRILTEAQETALSIIREGTLISKIDKAARSYIQKKGFGKYFGHALGHGLGLEVHEEPYICLKNKNRIKKGMVFTLEPAIYLPKKFGIRIEDIVYFNGENPEVLSATLDKSI